MLGPTLAVTLFQSIWNTLKNISNITFLIDHNFHQFYRLCFYTIRIRQLITTMVNQITKTCESTTMQQLIPEKRRAVVSFSLVDVEVAERGQVLVEGGEQAAVLARGLDDVGLRVVAGDGQLDGHGGRGRHGGGDELVPWCGRVPAGGVHAARTLARHRLTERARHAAARAASRRPPGIRPPADLALLAPWLLTITYTGVLQTISN